MSSGVFKQILVNGLSTMNTDSVSPRQWQVLNNLQSCRTPAMGNYHWHCNGCHQDTHWYCSCRDRHCPVCQGQAREAWLAKRQADMLPVTYHHLVFTLPHQFNRWASLHPEVLYGMLFKAVWATIGDFATARHHLEGQLGMMAVLHTWGQTLSRHIHLHCLIPGGVLTKEHQWSSTRKVGYLLPVKALSVKYRGKMLALLEQQSESGALPQLDREDIAQTLAQAAHLNWAVYSKPAITHGDNVVKYLARYCNRVGVSEYRLSLSSDNQVSLDYKDYQTDSRRELNCSTSELLRRFLLHILPKGFMRLRYYGFMANAIRRKSLDLIRTSLAVTKKPARERTKSVTDSLGPMCPHCHKVGMELVNIVLPVSRTRLQRTS